MKKAKKKAKKDMLVGLDDHGGKAGRDSSSSSSSSNSNSSNSDCNSKVTLTRVVIMVVEVGGMEET